MKNKSTKPNKQLTLTSAKQKRGADFETMALQFLKQQGLTLLYKNWLQPKVGEIDLIMIENMVLETGKLWTTLVFVEVRVRQRGQYGDAIESITKAKQRKIIKTATHFLQQYPEYQRHDCRFDVIGYDLNSPVPTTSRILSTQQTIHDTIPNVSAEWIQSAFVSSAW